MHSSHPGRVTAGQIVVDRDHVHALAFQRVQIGGKGGNQRLSFTGLHLRDTSLMENDSADQLHPERFHVQDAAGGLAHRGISLRKKVVKGLPIGEPLLEFPGLILQRLVGKCHHFRPQGFYFFHKGLDPLQLSLAVRTENFLNDIHLNTCSILFVRVASVRAFFLISYYLPKLCLIQPQNFCEKQVYLPALLFILSEKKWLFNFYLPVFLPLCRFSSIKIRFCSRKKLSFPNFFHLFAFRLACFAQFQKSFFTILHKNHLIHAARIDNSRQK